MSSKRYNASNIAQKRRKNAERRGHQAEWMAGLALMLKGYRIQARRYRCRFGEVDLIVRKGDTVAFVEVKARNDLATGVDAVTATAQRRILAAGQDWISKQSDAAKLSWRTDLVVVPPWSWPIHIEGAF